MVTRKIFKNLLKLYNSYMYYIIYSSKTCDIVIEVSSSVEIQGARQEKIEGKHFLFGKK